MATTLIDQPELCWQNLKRINDLATFWRTISEGKNPGHSPKPQNLDKQRDSGYLCIILKRIEAAGMKFLIRSAKIAFKIQLY